ncbi:hypothetical protein ES703_77470 [subsurface metagenome]
MDWQPFDHELRGKIKTVRKILASGFATVVSGAISGEIRHIVSIRGSPLVSGNYEVVSAVVASGASGDSTGAIRYDEFSKWPDSPVKIGNEDDLISSVETLELGDKLDMRTSESGKVSASVRYWKE